MITDAPTGDIIIPAIWETVFTKLILLVGGPPDCNVIVWPLGVERFVMSEDQTGYYVPSEGGYFGVWKEMLDEDHQ